MSVDYTTERYINDKGEIVTKITAKVNIPDGVSSEEYLKALEEEVREQLTVENWLKAVDNGILYGINGSSDDDEAAKWFHHPNAIKGREGTE